MPSGSSANAAAQLAVSWAIPRSVALVERLSQFGVEDRVYVAGLVAAAVADRLLAVLV